MGSAVAALAAERGWPVVARIGAAGNDGGAGITETSLEGADVAIEFTTPQSAPANIRACVRARCPVVVGTTAWDAERLDVERDVLAGGGRMLWAPNFSLGVNLFWAVAEEAARLAARLPGFDAHILEVHHTAKRDAPSGTALELAARTGSALGRPVPVTSIRVGSVPGTHALLLDGAYEQVRLEHIARDRRAFAAGALDAARWLVERPAAPGVFTVRDVLLAEIAGT